MRRLRPVWSARSDWFLVNHYQRLDHGAAAGLPDRQWSMVSERSACSRRDQDHEVRYGRLRRSGAVYASGWRWSRDGRRIAVRHLCSYGGLPGRARRGQFDFGRGDWEPHWIDRRGGTGALDPAATRVRRRWGRAICRPGWTLMPDSELAAPMSDGDLPIEPLREEHRAALKAACAEDLDIWELYSVSYGPGAVRRELRPAALAAELAALRDPARRRFSRGERLYHIEPSAACSRSATLIMSRGFAAPALTGGSRS